MNLIEILIKVLVVALYVPTICNAFQCRWCNKVLSKKFAKQIGNSISASIDRIRIKSDVARQMATHRSESNDKFPFTLKDYLSDEHPRYWFTVIALGEYYRSKLVTPVRYAFQGGLVFTHHGRHVVVAWTSKYKPVPSVARRDQILYGTVNAITKKVIF